jgi:hypothetical protein
MDVSVRKRFEENRSYASETQPPEGQNRKHRTITDRSSITLFEVLFPQAKGRFVVFTSASPRCLDRGYVDLLHLHHGIEGALCLSATGRKRIR